MVTHLPEEMRSIKCHKCDKTFLNKRFLDFHLLTHEGIKNLICQICGNSFYKQKDLTRHTNTVHLKVKNHVCKYCDKGFSNSGNLIAHLRVHTGELILVMKCSSKLFNDFFS